ncbi:MAG TPA: four helix bundle protein [Planctomycetota bacterium]|nr:four helix bundle protein [Planctomycetota bacterium]
MRDYRKLHVFDTADQLALLVYRETDSFPKREVFGLTAQMRRGAVSVPSNIVEGCARESVADYLHFLTIAYGSAKELEYQVSLAERLGYLRDPQPLRKSCDRTSRELCACIIGLKNKIAEAEKKAREARAPSPKPQATSPKPNANAAGHAERNEQ